MNSRLLVRTRTTVSSNISGPRDLQLRAALVAQGFVMTGVKNPVPADHDFLQKAGQRTPVMAGSKETEATACPGKSGHVIAFNSRHELPAPTPIPQASFAARNPKENARQDAPKRESARSIISHILHTTRAAWRRATGATAGSPVPGTPAAPTRRATRPSWSAVSHDIDGQDIKALLRSLGFADNEFRIHMEFQRGWGCM